MSSRRYTDAAILPGLFAYRLSLISDEIKKLPATEQRDPAKTRAARERGRVAFFTAYGVNTNPAQQHLTQTFVAGRGANGVSQQFMPAGSTPGMGPVGFSQASPQVPQLPGAQPMRLAQNPQPQQIDLSAYDGRNEFERIISMLKATDPAFAKHPWGKQCSIARAWRQQHLQAA
jgi:hypothetical protein